jgi:hypothetical protein
MTNPTVRRHARSLAFLLPAPILVLALASAAVGSACSDAATAPAAAPTTTADAAPPADAGGSDTGPGCDAALTDAADAAVAPILATTITPVDASKFELAEGLALRDGNAYVSLAPLGSIVRVSPAGVVTPYASVPPGYNDGYTLGLAFDAQGALFAAQTKNAPAAAVTPGIYKLPAGGSATAVATPFATDPAMTFPNGIAVGAQGDLLVTDSASGVVFQVTAAGVVSHWKDAAELQGSPACAAPLPFPASMWGSTDSSVMPTVRSWSRRTALRDACFA